ncbi:hypothetical protein DFH06DRAFT_1128578 [Mycena polygramma]|nr:hypothetical protein DFH06DRAFT_1128578 [Mycena polygramma]
MRLHQLCSSHIPLEILPVLYIFLDPTLIPVLDNPGQLHVDSEALVFLQVIFVVLSMLVTMKVPPGTGPDLWPRFWSWISFIDTHRSAITAISMPDDPRICLDALAFTINFAAHEDTRAIIRRTPGFRALLIRAWDYRLVMEANDIPALTIPGSLELILDTNDLDVAAIEEMIGGAGGALKDLARLAGMQLGLLAPHRDTIFDIRRVAAVCHTTRFILIANKVLASQRERRVTIGPFYAALMVQDFVRHVTVATRALSQQDSTDIAVLGLETCFMLLQDIWGDPYGYLVIPSALQHGLLHSIIACTLKPELRGLHRYLTFFVAEVFTPSTVYLHVLSMTETALRDVETGASTDQFRASPLFDDWREFAAVAAKRIAVLHEFETGDTVEMRACDNLSCGKMEEKSSFRRCSKCHNFYYCSTTCQRLDWTDGGHRKSCRSQNLLALSSLQRFSTRERTLMRALLRHDFQALRLDIYTEQVACMRANPGADYFVLFDYTCGDVSASVVPMVPITAEYDALSATRHIWAAEWAHNEERARRSAGRMTVHLMRLREGDLARSMIVPLRTSSSVVHEGLRGIAAELSVSGDVSDAAEIRRKVEDLCFVNADVVEIH